MVRRLRPLELAAARSKAFAHAERTGTVDGFREAEWLSTSHYLARRKTAARAVACPLCGAEVGKPCRVPSGRARKEGEHDARHELGVEANLVASPPRWVDGVWLPGVDRTNERAD